MAFNAVSRSCRTCHWCGPSARASPIVSRVISRAASDCSRTAANRPSQGAWGPPRQEVAGSLRPAAGSGQNQSVQRREALQRDLPAKRERGVLFRSISELHGSEMLGNGSKTVLDVLPIQFELRSLWYRAPLSDVDVRMFRVEMRHGHPFDRCAEIGLDMRPITSRVRRCRVETLAELRGDDQLPQPWVTALLPCEELRSYIDANGFRGEPGFLRLE
jgi:hypothetical protein